LHVERFDAAIHLECDVPSAHQNLRDASEGSVMQRACRNDFTCSRLGSGGGIGTGGAACAATVARRHAARSTSKRPRNEGDYR
jgi:hypothetical protein